MKKALLLSSILTPLALAACAGGGGHGFGGGAPSPNATATPATISSFAAGTVGATPPTGPSNGLQLATTGGAAFSGTTAPAAGANFALTQSAFVVSSNAAGAVTSITPDSATNAQGAILNVSNAAAGTYTLSIPSLAISTAVQANGPAATLANGDRLYLSTNLPTNPGQASSVLLGAWSVTDSTGADLLNSAYFITGYQTPAASMPTTGSATYSNANGVSGIVAIPSTAGGAVSANLTGAVSLSANFSTGQITGSLTDMVAEAKGYGATNWNSVSFTGQLSSSQFTGSTAATSAPGTSFSLASSATGTLNGGFYGASAGQAAAVWTLSDGSRSAVGVFGANLDPPPALIGVFDSPTYGPNDPTALNASTGGANFSGAGPSSGTVFSLNQSALAITALAGGAFSTVASDTATESAGATLTSTNPATGTYELKIPNLGVDVVLNVNGSALLSNGAKVSLLTEAAGTASQLNYAGLGAWTVTPPAASTSSTTQNLGYFVIGYLTPAGSMPSTGAATYSGTGNVTGTVFVPNANGGALTATLSGDASLTSNFATGQITGALSNMVASSGSTGPTAWNSVAISATISGASYTGGTTSSGTAPTTPFALGSSASGQIKGAFYGPTAQETAAVWTLSDGTRSAVGVLGAPQATAPSDRRLKEDIVLLRTREDGLRIYSFRYRGFSTRFEGVMAQDLLNDPRFAHAVISRQSGLLIVDYGQLDYACPNFDAMQKIGMEAVHLYEQSLPKVAA